MVINTMETKQKAVRIYLSKEVIRAIRKHLTLKAFVTLALIHNTSEVTLLAFNKYTEFKATDNTFKVVRVSITGRTSFLSVGGKPINSLNITDYVNLCVYSALHNPLVIAQFGKLI